MLKAVFAKICLFFAFSTLLLNPVLAANKIQPIIMQDAKNIALGAGLVKFCPLLSPNDYVSFTQDLLMAERLLNFEHSSDYKFIFKNQEIVAKNITQAGQACEYDILMQIINAELLMKRFISISPLRDELVIAHPQQPKLNQAFIFAAFLQARLAWVYQRKCGFIKGDALTSFNALLLTTQREIETVFRPEQAAKLNARIDERQYAAIIHDCKFLAPHVEFATEMMLEDLPDALAILKQF